MKIKFKILFLVISFSLCLMSNHFLSNEDYITGEDGVIRMYVNVMGHVKNPGMHMVYDNVDFMSALSIAGGFLQGADLKNIYIYSKDGTNYKINLHKELNSNSNLELIKLKPHDTIYIEQKKLSRFFISSNLPSMFLSLVNLAITLENTK